jgi:hypothetical protein
MTNEDIQVGVTLPALMSTRSLLSAINFGTSTRTYDATG